MSLKNNLKKLRNRKGLTQSELADISDVSMTQISKIERGESNNPELGTIKKLCVALECTADDLLFDRKLSSSSEALQHYFDKAMRLSSKDKAILIEIVHKFLMASDLSQILEEVSPPTGFELLDEESKLKAIMSHEHQDNLSQKEAQNEYLIEKMREEQMLKDELLNDK